MAKKQTWLFTYSAKVMRKARANAELTQTQLARKLKLQTPQYISNIERGLSRLSPKHMVVVANLTGTPLRAFASAHLKDERDRLRAMLRGEL